MSEDKIVITKHPTGSAFICDPPVTNTDDDWIVLVRNLDKAISFFVEAGWIYSGMNYRSVPAGRDSEFEESKFASVRNGRLNWILTEDEEYYDRFVSATLLAKKFNLLDKADRIQMFIAVIDGEYIDKEIIQADLEEKRQRQQEGFAPPLTGEAIAESAWRIYQDFSSLPYDLVARASRSETLTLVNNAPVIPDYMDPF